MTQSFRSALLVLGVLGAATLVIWVVLGGSGDPRPSEAEQDLARRESGFDPVDPVHLEGTGDGTRPRPSAGTDVRPGDGSSVMGLRTPHGIDLSDPATVEKRLSELMSDRPIDWPAVARLAAVYDGVLGDEVRRALLSALATGDRTGALRVLSRSRDGTLVRDLFELLDTGELTPGARNALIQGLALLPGANDAEVVRGLESRLTGVGRKDLQALKAIGQRGGREGARAIVEYLLRADQPELLPNFGYLSLDLRGNPAAVEVLTEAMAQAETPAVLRAFIKLSAQGGASGMVDSLIALDHGDQPQEVRRDVLEALARIGTKDSLEYVMRVAEKPGSYGELAMVNIGRMRSATPEARAQLVDALAEDGVFSRDPRAQRAGLQALGNLREKTALPAMVRGLASTDEGVRHVAAYGLGSLGEPARPHVPELIDLFSTGDERMQKQVATALGGIGGEEARSALEQMLTNDALDTTVRRSARMALQRLKMDENEAGRSQPAGPEGSQLGGRDR